MRKDRGKKDRLFRFVCIFFSLVMLSASLVCRVGIMGLETKNKELESAIVAAGKQADIYKVRLENRLSLSELERIATEEFGMHRPTPEQLIFSAPAG